MHALFSRFFASKTASPTGGAESPRKLGFFRNAFQVLWREIDPFVKKRLALAFACVVVAAVTVALAPLALKLIIDRLSLADGGAVVAFPVFLLAAYVSASWISRAVNELRGFLFGGAEQRLFRRLSRSLFSHIMTLPLRFHLNRKTGAIGQTLENGLVGYRLILQHTVFTVLPAILEIVTVSVVLLYLFPPAFLLIFALCMAAYGIVFAIGAARILTASRDVSTAKIDAHAILTDSILNYETVKLFNAENDIRDRYDAMLAQSESRWREFYRRRALNGLSVAFIFAAALAAILGLATNGVVRAEMTVGDFVLLNAYVLQISRPIEMLGFAFRDIGQGAAFIEKLLALLDEPREPSWIDASPRAPRGPAELTFENVSFGYHDERRILENVNLSIPRGKTTAIVGPSGSGKSSIIRLLMRFYDPDAGRILVDGDCAQDLPLSDLRQMIAVVPQDTILFNHTLAYNIGFGARDQSQEDIERVARLAHLDKFIESLPDGYETIVGERGLKLSGGEKQRVAIARAALKRPRIFAFDEATSALDTKTERTILQNLIEVSQDVTTIMIAHRLSTVIHADEIIVLHTGQVRESGSHQDLLAKNALYAEMWRSQNEAAVQHAEEFA